MIDHLSGQVQMLSLQEAVAASPAEELHRASLPDASTSSVIAPVTYPDEMEIPAELVGAKCKETIERFAPVLGTTPVNLLRSALATGLTGGRPVTEGMLDALAELAATDLPPPSKPEPSGNN